MPTRPRRLTSVASLLIVMFPLLLSACDRENRRFSYVQVIGPTPSARTAIVPPTLILSPVAAGRCPLTTAFDLVIEHQGRDVLFLDQVAIRLFDGSSVGGSPVLMSSADLEARFGSMRVRPGATRRFGLQPRFGCERFVPRSVRTDVVLRDAAGAVQTMTLVVPIG
jgi:hypothetical protein